jgi:uncharacterized protein
VSGSSEVVVADAPEASRYEARVGSGLAGFSAYRLSPGRITFTHTEVDPAFAGGGVGSRLARSALADARARGLAVRPLCPFIAGYIQRHPEYADLVVAAPGISPPA